MRTRRIAAILGILACGTVAALAEQREGPPPAPRVLEKLDVNLDGTVTRDEFEAAGAFDALDVNQDGVLTREDFPPPMFTRMPGHLMRMADVDRDRSVSPAEWSQFLASADPDGNGIIEKEALQAIAKDRFGAEEGDQVRMRRRGPPDFEHEGAPELTIEQLNAAFKDLDRNADGTLQADELPPPPRRGHGHGEWGGRDRRP